MENRETNSSSLSPELAIPDYFRPKPGRQEQIFPTLTQRDLNLLGQNGWHKIGIVATIINAAGEILMLEHKPDDNKILTPQQFGVLSETSKQFQNGHVIEQPLETISRGFAEELTVKPQKIAAYISSAKPYIVNKLPVGGVNHDRFALGFCPVIFVSNSSMDYILNSVNKSNDSEIKRAVLCTYEETFGMTLRDGIREHLNTIKRVGLFDSTDLQPLQLGNFQSGNFGNDILLT
jgi:hypothetical protein